MLIYSPVISLSPSLPPSHSLSRSPLPPCLPIYLHLPFSLSVHPPLPPLLLPPSLSLLICRDHLPPCTLSSLDASRMSGYWLGNQWFPFGCRLSNLSPSQLSQCLDGKNILLAGEGVTPKAPSNEFKFSFTFKVPSPFHFFLNLCV